MLRWIVLTLIGFGASSLATAEEVDRPIPQNPERQQQRQRDKLAWNRKTLVDAYDRVGKKDPRWDASAHETLEAAARYFSDPEDPSRTTDDVYKLAKRTVELGCDDPLLLYLYGRMSIDANFPGDEEYERRFEAGATALKASVYPVFRRYTALEKYAVYRANQEGQDAKARGETLKLLDEALKLVVESRAKDERNRDVDQLACLTGIQVLGGYMALGQDYAAAFDRVDAALSKAEDLKAIRLWIRGETLIADAWRARGNGPASDVTDEGWRLFHERLAGARKALEEAWALDPDNSPVAAAMLLVELGDGGERAEMEKWFERAMTADGSNLTACRRKMNWLDPKWHGTAEDLVAFGRACRDTKNQQRRIPLLLADAHFRSAQYLAPRDQRRYWYSSQVWRDVKGVFEEYLARHADDVFQRSRYAAFCRLAGRDADALKQFDLLGEKLVATEAFPLETMQHFRAASYFSVHARRAPTVELPPAPAGFRPLALAWDDPEGESGTLTTVNHCLTTTAGFDVLCSADGLFLLKEGKSRALRLGDDVTRNARLEGPCFDGRFVWAPVYPSGGPPFLLVVDPTAVRTWVVDAEDGLPFLEPEERPGGAAPDLRVAPLEPGRVCAVGVEDGSWIADVRFDPQNGASVEVLHQANEEPKKNDPDDWKRTNVGFRPIQLATLAEPALGGKGTERRVLVFRMGAGGAEEHPLVVDPDDKSVWALPREIRPYYSRINVPGAFDVQDGRFYWVEMDRATPRRSLMQLGAADLVGKPVVRQVGPVGKFVMHDGKVEFVDDEWWEAELGGGARPVPIKLPWLARREFHAPANAARPGGGGASQAVIRLAGLCYSRRLGILALCESKENARGVYQIDPNLVRALNVPAHK